MQKRVPLAITPEAVAHILKDAGNEVEIQVLLDNDSHVEFATHLRRTDDDKYVPELQTYRFMIAKGSNKAIMLRRNDESRPLECYHSKRYITPQCERWVQIGTEDDLILMEIEDVVLIEDAEGDEWSTLDLIASSKAAIEDKTSLDDELNVGACDIAHIVHQLAHLVSPKEPCARVLLLCTPHNLYFKGTIQGHSAAEPLVDNTEYTVTFDDGSECKANGLDLIPATDSPFSLGLQANQIKKHMK